MKLYDLLGQVISVFSKNGSSDHTKSLSYKEESLRDVVTQLDRQLHATAEEFLRANLPQTLLISEENSRATFPLRAIIDQDSSLLVDPVDGSNNLVLGLKEFGFMASLISQGTFQESIVVLPTYNFFIHWSLEDGLFVPRQLNRHFHDSATIYLAYASSLSSKSSNLRSELLSHADSASSGVYRYGSSCVGLYHCLTGAHSNFVGLELRHWDVLPFFPVLDSLGAEIAYRFDEDRISCIVSFQHKLHLKLLNILENDLGNFHAFNPALRLTLQEQA